MNPRTLAVRLGALAFVVGVGLFAMQPSAQATCGQWGATAYYGDTSSCGCGDSTGASFIASDYHSVGAVRSEGTHRCKGQGFHSTGNVVTGWSTGSTVWKSSGSNSMTQHRCCCDY